jgi:hypothetical protein
MHRYPDISTPSPPGSRSAARRLSLTAGVAAAVLAIAACGSSSKTSSTTANTTNSAPTVAPATTPTTATTAAAKKKKKAHPAKQHKAATTPTKTTTTTHTHPTTTTHPASTTPHTTSTSKPKAPPPPAFVKPMKATLVGPNHAPTANKLWPYTVTATDANGKPLSGTVDVEFTFHGTVVGHATPPTDPLRNGRWHDNLTFPPAAVGQPIALQVVIHTQLGTMTLSWPVKVKK